MVATPIAKRDVRPMQWIDSSRWPLLLVEFPRNHTNQDFESYLAALGQYRALRQPYAVVLNADHSSGLTAHQRRLQAEHVREGIEITRETLRGLAFVASSPFRRGMLTAIFWLQRPEFPYRLFSSLEEAKRWATEQLRPPR